MKKFVSLVFIAFIIAALIAMPIMAGAETVEAVLPGESSAAIISEPMGGIAAEPINAEHQDAPWTWAYLATIAGATAATLLITQFLKFPLDKVWKIPTRFLVYLIALVIMVVATAFTSGITLNSFLLSMLNAFIVALTAYGSYELTFAKVGK